MLILRPMDALRNTRNRVPPRAIAGVVLAYVFILLWGLSPLLGARLQSAVIATDFVSIYCDPGAHTPDPYKGRGSGHESHDSGCCISCPRLSVPAVATAYVKVLPPVELARAVQARWPAREAQLPPAAAPLGPPPARAPPAHLA